MSQVAEAEPDDDDWDGSTTLGIAEVASSIYGVLRLTPSLSIGDLAFGLQKLARKHQEEHADYVVQGVDVSSDRQLLCQLLDAIDIAYGAYKRNKQSLCAVSQLRLPCIKRFQPDNTLVRPAYFVAVDHGRKCIVWGFRGTKNVIDLLTDLGGSVHPWQGGHAHWGMLHSAHWFAHHELPAVARLAKDHPGYDLVLVGHSLGAGVAALLAYKLNLIPRHRAQLSMVPNIRCIGLATPAVLSANLAAACAPFVTTVVLGHDAVPRFSMAAVHTLQGELADTRWEEELGMRVLDEYLEPVLQTIESASDSTAETAARLRSFAMELLASRHVQMVSQAVQQAAMHAVTHPSAQATAAASKQAFDSMVNLVTSATSPYASLLVGGKDEGGGKGEAQLNASVGALAGDPAAPPPPQQQPRSDASAGAGSDSDWRAMVAAWMGMHPPQPEPEPQPPRQPHLLALEGREGRRWPAPGRSEAAAQGGVASSGGEEAAESEVEEDDQGLMIPLYPPGRLLFIEQSSPPGSSGRNGGKGGGAGGSGSAVADDGLVHRLVEGDPRQRAEPRIVLHPRMLLDHRMRAYRAAVVSMIRRHNFEQHASGNGAEALR